MSDFYQVTIKGRISNVAATVEKMGAHKVKVGKYFAYVIDSIAGESLHDLDAVVTAAGCWMDMIEIMTDEEHNAWYNSAIIHPAFQAISGHASNEDGYVDNDMCQQFVLEQLVKLSQKVSEADKTELRAIYADIRARGGDAYAGHKARLQVMNK